MPQLREMKSQQLSMGMIKPQVSESNVRNGDLEKEFTYQVNKSFLPGV